MSQWFSHAYIGIGQTGAILLFLLYGDWDAFLRRPLRIGLTAVFTVIHIILQAYLHEYLELQGWGSLPVFQFLAVTWCCYAFFIWLWYCPLRIRSPKKAPFIQYDRDTADTLSWLVCCFIALIFLLADNSVWPLISSASRMLYGINNLYDGSFLVRLLWISVFVVLECILLGGTRRLLPKPGKIVLDHYSITLTFVSVIPFLCIRLFLAQMENQDNKLIQFVMTVCCLVAIITLTNGVGRVSEQYEKEQESRMMHVLQTQQKLFEQKLNDIDAVNRKYHDMKNVLLYLQACGNSGEANAYSREDGGLPAAADGLPAKPGHISAAADGLSAKPGHISAAADGLSAKPDHISAAADGLSAKPGHTPAAADGLSGKSGHTPAAADGLSGKPGHTPAAADGLSAKPDHISAAADEPSAGPDGEIDRLLSSIRPYECMVRTGHEVIDIILNEKLTLCQKQNITCVPYLDGSLLSFVKPLDLCTIVGNAMDNAIESCSQIPDAEKRQISIHDFAQCGCVVLIFRNTFAHRPILRGGLPVTTKADSMEHGYGLKNILYITGQYNGTLNCAVEGEEFVLTLLLTNG